VKNGIFFQAHPMYHSTTITIVKFYNKVKIVKYKEAEPNR